MDKSDNVTTLNIKVPFSNTRIAEVVYHTLRVDAEPNRSGTKKNLELDGINLKAEFVGSNLSSVRVSVDSFFENIRLIAETIQLLGEPKSKIYNYFEDA